MQPTVKPEGIERPEDRKLEINGSRFTVGEILSSNDLSTAMLRLGRIIVAANRYNLQSPVPEEFANQMHLIKGAVEKYKFLRGGVVKVGGVTITYGDMAVNEFNDPTSSYFEIVGANGSTIKMTPNISNNSLIPTELNGENMNNRPAVEVLVPQLNKITVNLADAEIKRIEDEKTGRQLSEQEQVDRIRTTVQKALEGFGA